MENPTVQQAFADAVPMRRWFVGKRIEGYEGICITLGPEIVFTQGFVQRVAPCSVDFWYNTSRSGKGENSIGHRIRFSSRRYGIWLLLQR